MKHASLADDADPDLSGVPAIAERPPADRDPAVVVQEEGTDRQRIRVGGGTLWLPAVTAAAAHGRAARQALRTLLRQPLGSLLSLFMLAVAISLPLGLYLTVASLASWSNGLAASPQITLFMELNADRADVETVNQTLKQHALVHSHRFVSKESALKDLMARNGLADAAAGTGDQGDLARQIKCVGNAHDWERLD